MCSGRLIPVPFLTLVHGASAGHHFYKITNEDSGLYSNDKIPIKRSVITQKPGLIFRAPQDLTFISFISIFVPEARRAL